jgi:hypothetical protein
MPFFPEQPALHVLAVLVIGIAGGWAFYRLWRRFVPAGDSKRFWSTFPAQLNSMLASEESSEMLRHYRALLVGLGRYSFRNLFAVIVGLLPITIAYLLLDLLLFEPAGDSKVRQLNPLQPYLSDLELCLCVAATVGSIAAALLNRRRAALTS